MNLSQIRTRIRYRIGEDTEGFWSDVELNSYINDAKDDLFNAIMTLKKDIFIKTATLSFSANEKTKALPSDFSRLKSLRATTSGYESTTFSPKDLSTFEFIVGWDPLNSSAPPDVLFDVFQNMDDTNKAFHLTISPTFPGGIAIEAKYHSFLPDYASDSDEVLFLNPHMGYIIDKATYYALSKGPSGDYENYARSSEARLNRILGNLGRLNAGGHEFVEGFLEDSF